MATRKTTKGKKTSKSKTDANSKNTVAESHSLYTKELSTRIALSAKPEGVKKYHVILGNRDQWTVVADGNIRATRVFTSKDRAIEFARVSADRNKGIVIIHKENGEVEKRVSVTQ